MPPARSPVIYVLSGPNGAGKTTFAREFLPAAEVVEMASRAARLLLGRWRELLASRQSFGFESTLSGLTYATMLRRARETGYAVRLCYLWLPNATVSLRRVRQRVRKGGHDVPETDVRRRFLPSVRNFFTRYLPLADEALLFQAASRPPQLVARWKGTDIVIVRPEIYERIQKQAAEAA